MTTETILAALFRLLYNYHGQLAGDNIDKTRLALNFADLAESTISGIIEIYMREDN